MLQLQPLAASNFSDYEKLTGCENDGGCFCSFWHQRLPYDVWNRQCKTDLDLNRETVRSKMKAGFHIGALAYQANELAGWISLAPIPEFFWTWKRVAELGEGSATVAGIVCVTVDPATRGKGTQAEILEAAKGYARERQWTALEGYPFDDTAIERHGKSLHWPGRTLAYEKAGFQRVAPHWLSQPGYERSIFRFEL